MKTETYDGTGPGNGVGGGVLGGGKFGEAIVVSETDHAGKSRPIASATIPCAEGRRSPSRRLGRGEDVRPRPQCWFQRDFEPVLESRSRFRQVFRRPQCRSPANTRRDLNPQSEVTPATGIGLRSRWDGVRVLARRGGGSGRRVRRRKSAELESGQRRIRAFGQAHRLRDCRQSAPAAALGPGLQRQRSSKEDARLAPRR